MKRVDLARKLAKETRQSSAEARDQVDALVHKILKSLRAGKPVRLPGMGKLVAEKRNALVK
jgi:nucleoid DNA-binding protein